MNDVYRAIADPTRRDLLDALFERDGQTLSELGGRFAMTRFGVMKHLRVLEEAGLIRTERRGREKLHFLEAGPIRLLQERWIGKYVERAVLAERAGAPKDTSGQATTDGEDPPTPSRPSGADADAGPTAGPAKKVFITFIRTTPERLWRTLTTSGGEMALPGARNLVLDPPWQLVQAVPAAGGGGVLGDARVTWEIHPVGDACCLRVEHEDHDPNARSEPPALSTILSHLKTALDGGRPLPPPRLLAPRRPEAPHD